jgi:hypothetical protein
MKEVKFYIVLMWLCASLPKPTMLEMPLNEMFQTTSIFLLTSKKSNQHTHTQYTIDNTIIQHKKINTIEFQSYNNE